MTNHYRVNIPNYIIVNDEANKNQYVEYCVNIEHKISKNVSSLRFRYKELKTLHDKVTYELEKYKLSITLPEFPSRRLFSRTNTNKESILQRKYELEIYLNDLIQYTQVQALPMISSRLPSANDQLVKPSNRVKTNYVQKDDMYFIVESDCLDTVSKDQFNPLNNKSQLLVKIKSFDRTEETIFYNIDFYHQTSHLKWKVQSRYSDLKNLHLGVKACCLDKNINLPEFPGNHIFTSTNNNLDEVFKRQNKLEKYLNELLEIENIYPQNQALKNFIDSSKRQAFAEQLCKQFNQEAIPSHYTNKDIQGSSGQNEQTKINETMNKKQPRYRFSQKVDVYGFYFFNSTQELRQKQQKRILRRKAKKMIKSLNLQQVIEVDEQAQNEDNE